MHSKNKKIKIITLRSFSNYGNRLQNYALSKTLKDLGYLVKTTNCRSLKQLIYNTVILGFLYKPKRVKEHLLYKFSRKTIPHDFAWFNKSNYVVVGSDQVWNPDYIKDNPYLLDIKDDATKVSYAASIGMEKLTDEQKQMFKQALQLYSAISVREQSAKELLQPLTDKEISVVLDPTLLLDKKDYEELEKRPQELKKNEKYVLCYILGGKEYDDIIKEYASKNGCKVIYFSDKRESDYGIGEFLYLIHHAELICTDSFHACVFSYIFERPFVVFRRTGEADYMYTRIQNLFEILGLKNREFNGKEITKENINAEYSETKKRLDSEREKSLDYLRRVLK